jgi:hypothetical protein
VGEGDEGAAGGRWLTHSLDILLDGEQLC